MEVEEPTEQITIGEEPVDLDGLNYLAGKTMDFVNKSAMNGTILAHTDGQVPNLKVTIPAQDEKSLGQLFYMYEFACGVSGYILGVNPFNQPGVESYKMCIRDRVHVVPYRQGLLVQRQNLPWKI